MSDPDVTVVVVPRERFSLIPRSLDSLYAGTAMPFRLVYVDGGSPPRVQRYLEVESAKRGFRLIRSERYLAPNEARNMGLAQARGKYVVFIDNDVLVSPGWLHALVRCADETGAWLVGPLYCFGEPASTKVHMAGGTAHIEVRDGRRYLAERHHVPGHWLKECRSTLRRTQTELMEFHCLLARARSFSPGPARCRPPQRPRARRPVPGRARGRGNGVCRARRPRELGHPASPDLVGPPLLHAALERRLEPGERPPFPGEVASRRGGSERPLRLRDQLPAAGATSAPDGDQGRPGLAARRLAGAARLAPVEAGLNRIFFPREYSAP